MVVAIATAELKRLGVWTCGQMSYVTAAYRLADDFD